MVRRLVVVSNRLPVVLRQGADGWSVTSGSGGLVTALGPVLRGRGGIWIGWAGTGNEQALRLLDEDRFGEVGYSLRVVPLTDDEVERYYHGFANEVLWPLFHDLPSRCNFDPRYWPVYQQVNRKFARVILENTRVDDLVWIQDYHLMTCAAALREMGVDRRCAFFLHIPFPPLDLFLKLPWRFQILEGLLQHDLIGFQTLRDRRNFIQCARALLPGVRAHGGNKVVSILDTPRGEVRVGAFPIGIDFNSFARDAAAKRVEQEAWYVHEKLPKRQLILGVDRLDYSKGIPERIKAVGNALERYPELRGKLTFIQVVVPSRVDVPEYRELKDEIERLVGAINGRFTTSGWTPVHYIFRSLTRVELLAYYRTAEIALLTPLKDGMNLVAKEYCACSLEHNSVLVLSEFAGSAAQLQDSALLVNPHDIEGVADAIEQALSMPSKERKERMRRARRTIQRQDVFRWVDTFLGAAIEADLGQFPVVDGQFLPQPDAGEIHFFDGSGLPLPPRRGEAGSEAH